MSYCDDCLHKEVCGEEGVGDESMTFCRDKVISCKNAISRQAVLDCLTATNLKKFDFILDARDKIKNLPPVNPQESESRQFAKWVAEEIFDEENWEYNKDAFAEIACRKLSKLGIVRAKGDEWELIEPQERSDKE